MYMIEGTWSGYRSEQRRIVHRHYETNKRQADRISAIGFAIHFSDGTELELTVTEVRRRKEPVILGYPALIQDCIRYGTNCVNKLAQLQREERERFAAK